MARPLGNASKFPLGFSFGASNQVLFTDSMSSADEAPPLAPYERHVFVCTGPRCAPDTSREIYQALKTRLKVLKVDQGFVRRAQVQCFGICQKGPILLIYPEGVWYHRVTQEKLVRIIDEHLIGGKSISEWTFYPPI